MRSEYGKKEKNSNFDAERIFKEYMDAVVSFYQAEQNGYPVSIRSVADEFDTTILKIRKRLTTAGVFQSETSERV